MKTFNQKILSAAFIISTIFIAGCYTIIMSPGMESPPQTSSVLSDALDVRDEQTSDFRDCQSCHSRAELDDRLYDMERSGIRNAHGVAVDTYGWSTPETSAPWWIGVVAPPPPSGALSIPAAAANSENRRRQPGTTREGAASETPAASVGSSSAGGSNTSAPTAPSAASVAPQTNTAPPPARSSTPPPDDTRRRNEGNTRGEPR